MTAMDNASKNAGEMINTLKLQFNRARQASITNELIEVVSGAEDPDTLDTELVHPLLREAVADGQVLDGEVGCVDEVSI